MVRKERLELSRVTPLEPKSSASTNSATFAIRLDYQSVFSSCKESAEGFFSVRLYLFTLGVNDGTRTHDNRDHNPGLYQLSYAHHKNLITAQELVRPAGFEPATLGLEGRCSIQMSYGRIVGRGGGIRTPDILLPKQARYQTALHPVIIRPKDRAQILLKDISVVNTYFGKFKIYFIYSQFKSDLVFF